MTNTITEMKSTLEGINSRITEAEEWISDLEDRMVEFTAADQNKKGRAFIDGYWFKLSEDITILMEANTTSMPTNNVVCCELNKQTREITIKKRQNVSSVQIKPINNGNIHELVLCNIKMPVGVSRVTNDMIEDLRPDNVYCGFVETLVKQVDFQDLFVQFQDEFDMFMKNLKGKLSSDVAGSLQLQINELNNKINNMPVIRSGTGSVSNSVGKENDVYIQLVE